MYLETIRCGGDFEHRGARRLFSAVEVYRLDAGEQDKAGEVVRLSVSDNVEVALWFHVKTWVSLVLDCQG